jgi:hypothetical protein
MKVQGAHMTEAEFPHGQGAFRKRIIGITSDQSDGRFRLKFVARRILPLAVGEPGRPRFWGQAFGVRLLGLFPRAFLGRPQPPL